MKKALSALALAFVLAAGPAAAIPRPDIPSPAAAREPDLLDDYQRGVLRREMAKLQQDISAARRTAGEAEELAPLKAALEEARLAGDATNVAARAQALSDATETVLYRDNPGIPDKIKRLLEVGNLLEYDTARRKRERAMHPARPAIPPAKPISPPEDAPAAEEPAADGPAPGSDP